MRVIGLDVGERRTGVASGDTETGLATPAGVIAGLADPAAAAQAASEAASRSAEVIVVGMPYSMSGRVGPQAEAVERFVAELREAAEARIETVDERLSTQQAERSMYRREDRRGRRRPPTGASDASAAAVILQSWLDARR